MLIKIKKSERIFSILLRSEANKRHTKKYLNVCLFSLSMNAVFATKNSKHLITPTGVLETTYFPDGEISVHVENPSEHAILVSSTGPKPEHFLETAFCLDALKRAGTNVTLVIPYCGFARQDKYEHGKPLSIAVAAKLLSQADKTIIIDMHSERAREFWKYENILPLDVFMPYLPRDAIVVAPDHGAEKRAKSLAALLGTRWEHLHKERNGNDVRVSGKVSEIEGKTVILSDDILATGNTLDAAAKSLKEQGATKVIACITHCLFCRTTPLQYVDELLTTDIITTTKPLGNVKILKMKEWFENLLMKKN